ncbi:efflux RND transporter periplasmic adaptor subunit [Rhodanobacter sp. L36]|uniref:efflux RND transporter periplasmic adaptor subunit n=1 Tax=Rhodanobacter sp. L36 TaxID=1747221 RepID=UPI0020B11923|nr:efflux RND transporter periplasmic adaptor subunit [Rhodanobacter sp. L36]
MENKFFRTTTRALRRRCARPLATLMLAVAFVSMTACSSKTDNDSQAASTTPSNVTLTSAQRQNIHLYTVTSSPFHRTIEASGAVDFDNDQATSVLAAFSGPVLRLLVNPGDKVKKGDALAIVDSADFATAISTYRKALATANTDRRLADLEKDLVQHRGVAQREEDQAQTDAANADADAEAALQGLLALNVDAKTIADIRQGRSVSKVQSVIRAPIGGTVVEKLITPGQLLQAGTTACFTIADLSRVWVMAQVSVSDIASVSVGDPADVETGVDGKTIAGSVTNIASLVSPDTRLVAARVEVANPGVLLKKQMYVNVRIHSRQQHNGLLVPVAAVLRDDENLPFVYVAQADGSFARRSVTLGYRADDRYDIADGLRAGDQVVTDGGIFVQFMQNQ